MPEDKESLTIGYYLVALIDILGQKEKLRGLARLPSTAEEQTKFIGILKETYGTVEAFRNTFDTFFRAFLGGAQGPLPEMPSPMRQQFMSLRTMSVSTQEFADTVILYTSLRNDTTKTPINGIYAALLACGTSYLAMLAGRDACRGGIDIGVGFEPREGEIYGQALISAYDLERIVAQYPRIVIGQTLVRFLREKAQASGNDLISQYTRKLALQCLGLIGEDRDGHPFLDVLGEAYRQAVGEHAPHAKIVRDAYAFVIEEGQRVQTAGDTKLAGRYGLLRQYFEAKGVN